MPSIAYKHFQRNIIDVRRLIESHSDLSPSNPGRRKLGHLTRSGIVMLCACWELYAEDVIIESARYLASKFDLPDRLPLQVKKHVSKQVKEAKHELKPLDLAGLGWKSVYDAYCCSEVKRLNTPKSEKLKPLFNSYLGIDDITSMWCYDKADIDDFVTLRGNIAHNGRSSPYIPIQDLQHHAEMIYKNSKHMDCQICDYLFELVGGTIQPWRKTTK